ncbi:MAG: hypothetical protein AB8B63_25125 [Granulosicoccus sp.]
MTNDNVQADNVTMSTGGLYSLATIGAKHVIDKATPRVLEAIAGIDADADSHWAFSDMGCADGGTSLDLWRAVLQRLRSGDARDVQILYADQVFNDFNALVRIVHGHTAFTSYLNEFDKVHLLQSGSSFYLPVVPEQTLHLAFSATAMHWLRKKPCDIPDHVHMVGASGKQADEFSRQAAEDWQTILLHRARELKTGGKLVLVNFCIDEQGRYLGNTGGVNMFNNFNANWQSFVNDGIITEQEYESMTLPQYYNSVEEFVEPLTNSSSDVYKAGLRLVDIETAIVPCPFAEDFQRHQNAEQFAKAYIPTIRSWNESTFLGALSANRSNAERQQIIEDYYARYEQQVRDNPVGHGMGYAHAYMTIEKV